MLNHLLYFIHTRWVNSPTLQEFVKNPGTPGFSINSCSTADSRLTYVDEGADIG